jgi:hypothetical protein
MQSDRSLQVRKLLTESVREPRQSPHTHAHGQVLPFHITGADAVRIRVTHSDLGYNLRDRSWGVPRSGVPLADVMVKLRQSCVIDIASKRLVHGIKIEMKSVPREDERNGGVTPTTNAQRVLA